MNHNLSIEKIKDIISSNKVSFISLYERKLKNYNGMYEEYHFVYDENIVCFRHNFVCYGLDGFGDDLYKYYEYLFNNIEEIVAYLENKLQIKLEDMTLIDFRKEITQIDANREQTNEFKRSWKTFEIDFNEGDFLDKSLKLIE